MPPAAKKVMLLAGGAGSVLEYKATQQSWHWLMYLTYLSAALQVQVGPGCSETPFWSGTDQSFNKVHVDACSWFLTALVSSPTTFLILRTLIFCIAVGLLCGLLGAFFNALNIQAVVRRRKSFHRSGDNPWQVMVWRSKHCNASMQGSLENLRGRNQVRHGWMGWTGWTEAQTPRSGIGASLCLEFYCVVGLCQPL